MAYWSCGGVEERFLAAQTALGMTDLFCAEKTCTLGQLVPRFYFPCGREQRGPAVLILFHVQNGTTYYYVTTAVDASGNESTYSNQASAAIP